MLETGRLISQKHAENQFLLWLYKLYTFITNCKHCFETKTSTNVHKTASNFGA